jgi:hypothetical protein
LDFDGRSFFSKCESQEELKYGKNIRGKKSLAEEFINSSAKMCTIISLFQEMIAPFN